MKTEEQDHLTAWFFLLLQLGVADSCRQPQEGGGGDSAPLGKLTEEQIEKGQELQGLELWS